MKLIVNADDFGLCKGVNDGIIDAYKSGIVTSTTMLANMPAFDDGIALLKENPGLAVGVHLILTGGSPVTKCDSLCTNNSFYKLDQISEVMDNFDFNELKTEFKGQIDKIVNQGIQITHLDGHHHIHTFDRVIDIVKELASEYNLVIRNVKNDSLEESCYVANCDINFYDTEISKEYIINLKDKYKVVELMCHPAKHDGLLERISSYSARRVQEFDILTNKDLKDELNKLGVTLITYRDLR